VVKDRDCDLEKQAHKLGKMFATFDIKCWLEKAEWVSARVQLKSCTLSSAAATSVQMGDLAVLGEKESKENGYEAGNAVGTVVGVVALPPHSLKHLGRILAPKIVNNHTRNAYISERTHLGSSESKNSTLSSSCLNNLLYPLIVGSTKHICNLSNITATTVTDNRVVSNQVTRAASLSASESPALVIVNSLNLPKWGLIQEMMDSTRSERDFGSSKTKLRTSWMYIRSFQMTSLPFVLTRELAKPVTTLTEPLQYAWLPQRVDHQRNVVDRVTMIIDA
jgi:hypothetical protein